MTTSDLGSGSFLALVGLGALAFAAVSYVIAYMAFLKKASPSEVIVRSGRGRVGDPVA